MALEYIKVSQLLLGVCKLQIKYLYISYFFNFIEMVQLEVYVEGSFKYPANIYLFKLNNKHASPNLGGGGGGNFTAYLVFP